MGGVVIMGGVVPACVVAVLAFGVDDWFFIPPLHNLTIGHPVDAIALAVFLTVAVAVSAVGERAARRTVLAARSQAEAEALARLAASSVLSAGEEALPNLLSQLREAFGLTAVAVLCPDGHGVHMGASAWDPVPPPPEDASFSSAPHQGR